MWLQWLLKHGSMRSSYSPRGVCQNPYDVVLFQETEETLLQDRVRHTHNSTHCRHKGRWQTLRDCVVKVTFFLAISYLLVVPAFFFFHLLLGLFPLFLQLILFLLVPLLSWDGQRTFGSDHCTPSLGCPSSSKAPCTIHYKILFVSEHLESNACTP